MSSPNKRCKFPVGAIVVHKKYGYVAKIHNRSSYEVEIEMLTKCPAFEKTMHYWYNEGCSQLDETQIVIYSPSSINKIFIEATPAYQILYGNKKG